ncbi:MAG TPA: GSCFA domain-containing protein, partial [Chloroflexota bacterium]|nr:GSCFA domain-containing protein [Chloroflexota bacterium]
MTTANPYSSLPESAFWKTAVATKTPTDISGLWNPKFNIGPQHKVVTFGSCFAQHIGRALRARGYSWLIAERPPEGLSEENQQLFNYDLFSCRTGNIYTSSLLKQWVEWALGEKPEPDEYWVAEGRYYDPFRPVIEPNGFDNIEEMRASRQCTIAAFRRAITDAKYFVFTLGLTESWFNKTHGYEYPMCPGTAAGTFNPEEHEFKNQHFEFVRSNLLDALTKIRSVNKAVRIILTVSPVPLTATNSGRHVLTATMESKSILRAVAGQLRSGHGWVDYFPSYEIISSPVFGGQFFEANLRSVAKAGVDFVMDSFFADLANKFGAIEVEDRPARFNPLNFLRRRPEAAPPTGKTAEEVVCEEQL